MLNYHLSFFLLITNNIRRYIVEYYGILRVMIYLFNIKNSFIESLKCVKPQQGINISQNCQKYRSTLFSFLINYFIFLSQLSNLQFWQQQLPLFLYYLVKILCMSVIEAIGIAGFRSYSPSCLQKIEFSKPLTLIWGPNGAGKTTIIQVMKFIMAGILPPSCERGKNFVIDPRILGKSDIKGEIRLRFKAYMGRPVMAIRRSMLSLNNKGAKFQSTQQILKTKDQNGEDIEINHHCAQIQKQIPFLLGTSRAIIDKVMFCHQEQSLWPFEDSAVLKTIFDQLFETKKYTQMIEVLWDQRKQYQKKIGEIKKALPYLQRIYQEDKRRKYTSLKQMEQVRKQAKEIVPIRQQLQKMQSQLSECKDLANGNQRIRLAQEKRSLEDKVKSNIQILKKINQKIQIICNQFYKLTETKLTFQNDQIQEQIKYSQSRINQLKKQREQLSRILQNIKFNQTATEKERDLQNEINVAKQFLPELKKESKGNINQELILRKITEKKQEMENKIKKIKSLQAQLAKCNQFRQKFMVEKLMSQTQYQSEKSRLQLDTKLFQQIKMKILCFYFALYKPIDQKASLCNKQDDVSTKLQEVSIRIKMKRQELQKYKLMPKGISINKKIDRMEFAGIQFYDNYISYCNQKKKCSFCSKPMTAEELRTITAKCQKIKEKSEGQIKQLQQQLEKTCVSQHLDGDPQIMIEKLTSDIDSLLKLQKTLTERMKNYEIAMKWKEQRKLNEKLTQGIKIVKFQREVEKGSASKYQKYSKDATIQLYNECIRKYIDMSNEIAREKRNIEIYQQQQIRNKQRQILKEKNSARSKAITEQLKNIQQQTKSFQVIVRIVNRLTILLKEKQKMNQFKQKEDKSQIISAQLIIQKISSIDQQIKKTQLKSEFYSLNIKLEDLKQQNLLIQKEINEFEQKIEQIQKFINEIQKRQEQYNKLKTEYEKNAHTLNIRADISFSQYKRGSEKEYLIMKSRLQDAENASKDIETYCRVVENTISKLHQEKMDQINKILSDIWKEVYHQQDITSIQIETLVNEDSKKRRNYHYSIVMYKAGPEKIKLQMRGRCSMGQKVLASLVIRMALAEVFASSARFLALDEPTTNLDQQHIDSLAQELIKIIEMNQGANFQMVIITHDMELIKKLERYTNHFYEVSRDQNKFSVINKKDIGELYRKF